MSMTEEEFLNSLEPKPGVKVKFGLEAQGHIPTVEKMLSEGRYWSEINDAIGWAGDAAERDYHRFLRRDRKKNLARIEELKEALRKLGDLAEDNGSIEYYAAGNIISDALNV